MSDLLNCGSVEDIHSCIEVLKDNHIAVWDVIASRSYQTGSMDRDITDPVFNDIPEFIFRHPTIRYIGTNGGKAWECFRKSVNDVHFNRTLISERLPSTSPAYAACSYGEKLLRWQNLLLYINQA
jgi:hypoxanthine-DNA glycosylase